MAAYYNEFNPHAAAWLRKLIAAGQIAPGEVDERSILDVRADDLVGFQQCHFFAGIGGWSLALRLANVPDDANVWTGSCPCQPFSLAGHQRGSADARHLWPTFFDLIRERRPPAVFGEQVAGAPGYAWLDHVLADLESEGYAAAAADLPACSVGAPHGRPRLYWAATDAAGIDGRSHDRVVPSGERATQEPTGRLPRVVVSGGWWKADAWTERQPTLVRNHDGLSHVLAGFGNAIVPQVAAAFIECVMADHQAA